jgi:hypothetical protein
VGATVVTGDLGVSPGTAVTGFPPGLVVNGTIHSADFSAGAAQGALTAAFTDLGTQACTQDLTGQDLGGMTLTPGVYCFTSSAQLTGILTLNAQGNPAAVFIFKMGSTITTASNSAVLMINGGNPCNVFWRVGSSATLGSGTAFAGNIMAEASITFISGAGVIGRALARSGAVTLGDSNVNATCTTVPGVCPAITLSPATLPNGTVQVAYSQQITGSGGTEPYTFAVTNGTLPAGLTLTSSGLVSGTPTTVGTSVVTIRGTDANGCFAEVVYTISVAPEGALCQAIVTFTPATLSPITAGVPYSQTFTGSGGTPPYVFTVVSGALPNGLALSPAGVLSGTPLTAGDYTFTIRVTDAQLCVFERSYTLSVITAAPTLPQIVFVLLAVGLIALGYQRLRRRSSLRQA